MKVFTSSTLKALIQKQRCILVSLEYLRFPRFER